MKKNKKVTLRILMMVDDPEVAGHYQSLIKPLNIQYDQVRNDQELLQNLSLRPYNGILLDVPTSIRVGSGKMNVVRPAMSLFPTLRLTYNKRYKKVKALLAGHVQKEGINIPHFITNVCAHFPARQIRSHKRKALYARVLMATTSVFNPGQTQKSTTLDISLGGCFLYSLRSRRIGQTLWLRIANNPSKKPLILRCKVRRRIGWNDGPHLAPGIGVAFLGLGKRQRALLERLLE